MAPITARKPAAAYRSAVAYKPTATYKSAAAYGSTTVYGPAAAHDPTTAYGPAAAHDPTTAYGPAAACKPTRNGKTDCDVPFLMDFSESSIGFAQVKPTGSLVRTHLASSRTVARRGELKYILDEKAYQALRAAIRPYVEPDSFACSPVCSLYFDTAENALVRRSLEKPAYKEKLRIRTYKSNPAPDDTCFLEIKKKVRGTVYKRRAAMTLAEAIGFCRNGKYPWQTLMMLSYTDLRAALQILQEVEWLFSLYGNLEPSFTVSCKRLSLKEKGTDSLRITFDRDIRWSLDPGMRCGLERDMRQGFAFGRGQTFCPGMRQGSDPGMRPTFDDVFRHDLDSETYIPANGENALMDPEYRVMEVKGTKGMPLWLVGILDELEVYPRSFSKVGRSYQAWLQERNG